MTTMLKVDRRGFLRLLGGTAAVGVLGSLAYASSQRHETPPRTRSLGTLPSRRVEFSGPTTNPLLLLTNGRSTNPFGHYLGEILLTEGLNLFHTADLGSVDEAFLRRYRLTLLTEGPLDTRESRLLEDYVGGGGRLIAMRPDTSLASLLGLERRPGTVAEGYVLVDTNSLAGRGIVAETLQFHGEADSYQLVGAEPIAWLYRDADTRTSFPAVTARRFGRGIAAMWAFDLARSVAYTRQGNPVWANSERDGLEGVRAVDMFVGWLDLGRIGIPQADELQRLLVNLMTVLMQDVHPLPRLWYFPAPLDGLVVATADAHGDAVPLIENLLQRVERHRGRMTIYYAPPAPPQDDFARIRSDLRRSAANLPLVGTLVASPHSPPAAAQVSGWRARGHEFGIHPYVENGVEQGYRKYIEQFHAFRYDPIPPTVRTHAVLWKGWVQTAEVQAANGLRMNLDYYHHGPFFRDEGGRWVWGHFTGSALPMKFVNEHGHILDIYQQPTQLVDEHLLKVWTWSAGLSGEEAVAEARAFIDHGLKASYGPAVVQFHVHFYSPAMGFYPDAVTWTEGVLDYAVERGLPIWSAEQWLAFVDARHDACFGNLQWNSADRRLTFTVEANMPKGLGLSAMLPVWHGGERLVQVLVDGVEAEIKRRLVAGISYACVEVPSDIHHVEARYAFTQLDGLAR